MYFGVVSLLKGFGVSAQFFFALQQIPGCPLWIFWVCVYKIYPPHKYFFPLHGCCLCEMS